MSDLAAFYAALGALDLPMPTSTQFVPSAGGQFVSLGFRTVDDGQAWAGHLGVGPLEEERQNDGARRVVSFYGRTDVTVGGMRVCLSAYEDIPGEGEVVVSSVPAELATAPTEPVPDVWVARRRRGIHYHQTDGQWGADCTGCGRAARQNGNRVPLTEAESFGAVPCPRCYGGTQ